MLYCFITRLHFVGQYWEFATVLNIADIVQGQGLRNAVMLISDADGFQESGGNVSFMFIRREWDITNDNTVKYYTSTRNSVFK